MHTFLSVYLGLKVLRLVLETSLSVLNRRYYENSQNQENVCRLLNIEKADFTKALAYANDRQKFSLISLWSTSLIFLIFLVLGGFGWIEGQALAVAEAFSAGTIVSGLLFFAILGLFSLVLSLPFSLFSTFVIEARHGFNRQTPSGFVMDLVKSLLLGAVLGGVFLAGLLKIMEVAGDSWWIWAWAATTLFSLATAWIYPAILAPLFNKFTPLTEGPLKDGIEAFARKIGFETSGISLMDASRRSSHGNAYFTGVFGKKRIVLFDTLVSSMNPNEIIAVLAHELGHFKLNHVRWGLIRGTISTGVMFYLLHLGFAEARFYEAFFLQGVSSYGALLVFSLWLGTVDFYIAPLGSWISRKNEFQADNFASRHLSDFRDLCSALLKLRESNHAMPLSHPIFSAVYHSHPPIAERLMAMGYEGNIQSEG